MKRILIILVILMFACCNVPEPVRRVAPAEAAYEIVTIFNGKGLAITAYAKERLTECGLSDDEFKKYVFKQIKGTGYSYEPSWDWRKTLTGEKCIARAFVYYKKNKERK